VWRRVSQSSQAGARLRATGDQATNDGVRRFSVRGTYVSSDSAHLVLRSDGPLANVDTVVLFGVRRLDLFEGHRSRSSMVVTGATLGAIAGTGLWWFAHQVVRPGSFTDTDPNDPAKVRTVSEPLPPIIHQMRNAIPVFIGAGAVIGLTIGDERWVRIAVPQSVFSQTR
jgi:hypothetical protein